MSNEMAFPLAIISDGYVQHVNAGLTKRELIAAMAMQGLRAARMIAIAGDIHSPAQIWSSRAIAAQAVRDADALLAELAKERKSVEPARPELRGPQR